MSPRGNIVLWLLATVAAAALTAYAVTSRVPRPDKSAAGEVDGKNTAENSLHDWMHAHLALTAEQHALMDPLETTFERERVALRQHIRQLGNELAVGIRDGEDATRILEKQSRLNTAQGELQELTLRHFLEMKKHLSPDQAKKLADWTHDSILLQPGN
ncbi:MAG: protein of unknown function, Spy-related [Verrucomicrobiales bacterium]|nr:protein of unknown function, Spy-related [Verrucomicrobiales bacterium]